MKDAMRETLRLLVIVAGASLALVGSGAGPVFADVTCPTCSAKLNDSTKFCPQDGTPLARDARCTTCNRQMQGDWSYCPYDATPLRKAEPANGTGSKPTTAPVIPGNPYDTVEGLFKAILAGEEDEIRELYHWPSFYPDKNGAELDEAIKGYVRRLIDNVRPTLANTKRETLDIKLGKDSAKIRVALLNAETRREIQVYSFDLVGSPEGWKIASINP